MRKQLFGVLLFLGAGTVATAQTTDTASAQNGTVVAVSAPEAPAVSALELAAFIREASKTGGELDFMKMMAPKKQTMFVYGGNMYNKQEYALMLWGTRVKELGLTSAEQACTLYTEATRHALTAREKQALLNGFNNTLN